MSIEIVGPQKYRFQDGVCGLIGLMYAGNIQAELYIEPENGEDAQLTLVDGTGKITIEIQVKGGKAKVDMEALADWMSHFPTRSSSGSLIERLVQDQCRIVLMISTGRCDDASSIFHCAQYEIGSIRDAGTITKKSVAALRKGFERHAAVRQNERPLAASRRQHIDRYISALDESDLRQAAHRIKLFELVDDEKLERERYRLLTEIHGLPPDIVQNILAKIDAIVISEKRTGTDILPRIWDLISQHRPKNSLRPTNYLIRGDEQELQKILSNQGYLLLCGRPRVGKTSTARWITANLQDLGYKVLIVESIAAAQRFLMDPVAEARLALVDDPFGGAHPTDAPAREFERLGQLLTTLPSDRRLVVAQAEDRLLEVARKTRVDEVSIAGVPWIPLENEVGSFLAALWIQECNVQGVPSGLAEEVRQALLFNELRLEPGCIVHLAINHRQLPFSCDLDSIERLARQDAAALAAAFRSEGLAPVAAALAVGTTAGRSIAPLELAFALRRGAPERPGKATATGTMANFGGELNPSIPTPAFFYDAQPTLTDEQDAALEQLEIRRIVEFCGGSGYIFTHPSYRAGSEFLIDAATRGSTRSALATIERCLFSLSSDTANAAAANLPWLYERLDTPDARDGVVTLAIDGMKSMWPDTREKCLQFLARRFSEFTYEQREKISKGALGVSAFGREEIKWADGRPFIPRGDFVESDFFKSLPSTAVVERTLMDLADARRVDISAEVAADAAEFLSRNPSGATAQIVGRLLSFELATLVRAPAAKAWLRHPRDGDEVLLARIFAEEQPAIVSAVFAATVEVWWGCNQTRRDALQAGLLKMAASPVAAFTLFGHLVKFNRREETGSRPPWLLFEALMPEVMRYLPILPTQQATHLYAVMRAAIQHVQPVVVLTIVDVWLTIAHEVALRTPLNDYFLGFITILLDSTQKTPAERIGRIASALSLPGTGTRTRVVMDIIDRWSDLTTEERAEVIWHLQAGSSDSDWLRAAAITRPQVPTEIQQAILPSNISLASSPKDLILAVPSDLLKACLRLYTLDHPALEESALRRSDSAVWEPVLEAIAMNPEDRNSRLALRCLIHSKSSRLSALIALLGNKQADLVFKLLLEYVTHSGGVFLPEAWEALLGLELGDAVRHGYFQRMFEESPRVIDHYEELEKWIPEPHISEFLQQFVYDLKLIKFAGDLSAQSSTATPDSNALTEYLKLIERKPPMHWLTYQRIIDRLQTGTNQNREFLEKLRQLSDEARTASRNKPDEIIEPLANWLSPIPDPLPFTRSGLEYGKGGLCP